MPQPTWDRPDGQDLKHYSGHEKWHPVRWAWEFLRRNKKFAEECERLPEGLGAEQAQKMIAEEYGLKRFKDYRDAFRGTAGPPRFHGRIRIKSNPTDEVAPKKRKFLVHPATVVIVFDLTAELHRKGALSAQIEAASKVLNDRFKEYLANTGKKPSRSEGPESHRLLRDLRILDLLDSGAARTQLRAIEIANHDNPLILRRIQEGDKQIVRSELKFQVAGAKALTTTGYRYLGSMN